MKLLVEAGEAVVCLMLSLRCIYGFMLFRICVDLFFGKPSKKGKANGKERERLKVLCANTLSVLTW